MTKRAYRRINPAWHKWQAGIQKLRATIRGLRDNPTMHNQRWRDNTMAHYMRIEAEQRLVEPPKYLDS